MSSLLHLAAFPKIRLCNQKGKIILSPDTSFCVEGTFSLEMQKWLFAYAKKESLPFPLPDSLSSFAKEVVEQLLQIPFGEKISYGELAERAGHPKAYRPVGRVCNQNPYPLFIPCHRVIGEKKVGGYAFGKEVKERLLAFESNRL